MLLLTLCWSLFASVAFAAFGYTDQGTYWTIDSGSNLVIQVSKTNGDITSMKYKVGNETSRSQEGWPGSAKQH